MVSLQSDERRKLKVLGPESSRADPQPMSSAPSSIRFLRHWLRRTFKDAVRWSVARMEPSENDWVEIKRQALILLKADRLTSPEEHGAYIRRALRRNEVE